MRRFLIPALMISLLLTGCGNGGAERKLRTQQEKAAGAAELSFTAEITAELSEEVFSCTLACTADAEGVTAELLAPESLAGIRARVGNGETRLEYENLALSMGTAGLEHISPVSAAPLLAEALRSGFLRRCWTEKDGERTLIAAEIYVTDDAELSLWFDGETMAPVHGEFYQNGSMVLRCEIRDFILK